MSSPNLNDALVEQITRRVVARLQGELASTPPASAPGGKMLVPCNISVRHIHLDRKSMDALYGPGSELEVLRPLYQTGEFASKQTLTLVGPRMRCLGEVRILGPLRKYTQVEVSRTDAIYLGIDPPVNRSGDHTNSEKLILVGPHGVLHLQKGVILANRHIHISVESAKKWGLSDNQSVRVRIEANGKKTILEECQIRVLDLFKDEMHLDTDDGNACGLRGGEMVEILP
ncbi:MAG: phosphate propanoyltransferase [bacterium]|nr:phosphate propanoyltransferase [bacterium]